jgi:hypothetical protein
MAVDKGQSSSLELGEVLTTAHRATLQSYGSVRKASNWD